MDASLKKLWVEALRSGRYTQAKYTLKGLVWKTDSSPTGETHGQVMGHCCLGVLCDIIDPHGWLDEGSVHVRHRLDDGSGSLLSSKTKAVIGLRVRDSKSNHVGMNKLARLNDDVTFGGFEAIADLIEREF